LDIADLDIANLTRPVIVARGVVGIIEDWRAVV
jgi:hypothetical protein